MGCSIMNTHSSCADTHTASTSVSSHSTTSLIGQAFQKIDSSSPAATLRSSRRTSSVSLTVTPLVYPNHQRKTSMGYLPTCSVPCGAKERFSGTHTVVWQRLLTSRRLYGLGASRCDLRVVQTQCQPCLRCVQAWKGSERVGHCCAYRISATPTSTGHQLEQQGLEQATEP